MLYSLGLHSYPRGPTEWNSTITMALPTGCSWSTDGKNLTVSAADGATIKTGEYFDIYFDSFDDTSIALYKALSGDFTVEYESEHAWQLTQRFALNTQESNTTTAYLTVPYLFYEDFSSVESFSSMMLTRLQMQAARMLIRSFRDGPADVLALRLVSQYALHVAVKRVLIIRLVLILPPSPH